MAKFYGMIGFAIIEEKSPGVWKEHIEELPYFGDLVRNSRRLRDTANRNDGIDVSNEISIVADPFAYNNFHSIRYVEFMNSKWKVESVEVEYPRLRLTLGGLYHGEQTGTA